MSKNKEVSDNLNSFLSGLHNTNMPEKSDKKPEKPVKESKIIPAKQVKKASRNERIVEIPADSKRRTSGFFIFPEYQVVINQIMLHKNHRKVGGTLEFLVESYLHSLSENELKSVLKIKINDGYY